MERRNRGDEDDGGDPTAAGRPAGGCGVCRGGIRDRSCPCRGRAASPVGDGDGDKRGITRVVE